MNKLKKNVMQARKTTSQRQRSMIAMVSKISQWQKAIVIYALNAIECLTEVNNKMKVL